MILQNVPVKKVEKHYDLQINIEHSQDCAYFFGY